MGVLFTGDVDDESLALPVAGITGDSRLTTGCPNLLCAILETEVVVEAAVAEATPAVAPLFSLKDDDLLKALVRCENGAFDASVVAAGLVEVAAAGGGFVLRRTPNRLTVDELAGGTTVEGGVDTGVVAVDVGVELSSTPCSRFRRGCCADSKVVRLANPYGPL